MRSDWTAGFTDALEIRCNTIGPEYEAKWWVELEEHSHESPGRSKDAATVCGSGAVTQLSGVERVIG